MDVSPYAAQRDVRPVGFKNVTTAQNIAYLPFSALAIGWHENILQDSKIMKIAFIGYGNMAASLASRWVAKHDIFVGGRDTKKAQNLASRLGHWRDPKKVDVT